MGNEIVQFPIPLISKKIYKDHLSGELKIEGDGFKKNIYFSKGLLNFATTTITKERLSTILLDSGKIDKELLYKLDTIKSHTNSKKMVGEILRKISDLKATDISTGLLNQIKTITTNSFPLKKGEWVFLKKNPIIPNPVKFSLKLPLIIKEGINKTADLSYFMWKFKDSHPIVINVPDVIQGDLSEEESEVLAILQENSNQSIDQMFSNFKGNKEHVWHKIITFYLLNILVFSYTSPLQETLNSINIEINRIHDRIESNLIDYYEVLGLTQKATKEEIENQYLLLISRYHPDRLTQKNFLEIEDKINRVISEINTAYKILSNDQRKEEYDRKGKFLQETQDQEEFLDERQKARKLYLISRKLFKQKKYQNCACLLKRAISFDSTKANYFMLLGLSQGQVPSLRRNAVESFNKVAELEPWNPEPLYAVGDIFRSEKLMVKAKYYFEKALEKDMEKSLPKETLKEFKSFDKKSILSFFKKD